MRFTKADLDSALTRLNNRIKLDTPFTLDGNNRKYRLVRGDRNISSRLPMKALADYIDAFLEGAEFINRIHTNS